jgi:hypothetical protein
MFLVAVQPTENPPDIAQRFNLVLMPDELAMGPAMARQAHKMGATTFVHLSFPRHMAYPLIFARHELIKEECAKLGIEFVDYTVQDPTGEIGMVGRLLEDMPRLIKEYDEDTAFFCTNCGLQIPLIKAVVDVRAIYVQPCCPSPFHGFPLALGLVTEEYYSIFDTFGNQDTVAKVVAKTTEKLREKGMLGRVSTWPVPVAMMNTVAATEYAIKWINEEVPQDSIDIDVLEQCMADYTGVAVSIRTLGTYEADSAVMDGTVANWVLVIMDYLTYGE